MRIGHNLVPSPYKITHKCVNMRTGEVLYEDVFIETLYEPASNETKSDLHSDFAIEY